ncbi:hypothetical protein BDF21DRAFT_334796, partial [Thamnidium elegans]
IDSGTDEISTDEKVRKASRSFRQTFDVSPSERLVNCKKKEERECIFNKKRDIPTFSIYRLFKRVSYQPIYEPRLALH